MKSPRPAARQPIIPEPAAEAEAFVVTAVPDARLPRRRGSSDCGSRKEVFPIGRRCP